MTNDSFSRIEELRFLDPDIAHRVETGLQDVVPELTSSTQAMIIGAIIKGLVQETTFGNAIADGFLDLIQHGAINELTRFRDLVDLAGKKGPSFGWVVATYTAPILRWGDQTLLTKFLTTLEVLGKKGAYTFHKPLKGFHRLLRKGEHTCAAGYLDLLCKTFSQDLTYNQSLHYTHTLPKAVLAMVPQKRSWQVRYLAEVMCVDNRLADALLKGLPKGLHLLSQKNLGKFVVTGLEIYHQNKDRGTKFFGLDSKLALDTLSDLQIAVALYQLQPQMNRYLRARTGLAMTVRSITQLPKRVAPSAKDTVTVCSDGKNIYLPDQIDRSHQKIDNQRLYHCLVRFESGYYEFGTYDFDLEKWRLLRKDRSIGSDLCTELETISEADGSISELDRFFQMFSNPVLAKDLFTIFEHGRIHHQYAQQYPGLLRHYLPILQQEARRIAGNDHQSMVLAALYRVIALRMTDGLPLGLPETQSMLLNAITADCQSRLLKAVTVDDSIDWVVDVYPTLEKLIQDCLEYDGPYRSPAFPFDRQVRPELVHAAHIDIEDLAVMLQNSFRQSRIHVFRSDLKQVMRDARGLLNLEQLDWISQQASEMGSNAPVSVERIAAVLANIQDEEPLSIGLPSAVVDHADHESVSWYWEWDNRTEDYLYHHVRVVDRGVPPVADAFYEQALDQYDGLVSRIKNAFEMMKPEGLKRLRQWVEGDEFDYRALVDHVVDRWIGQIPSDRLYIKKIKHRRDVSALLLVDLSRSTANRVSGSAATVLQVEKEAIVLFAEALQVVGDDFAIAGYSGTGRLGVDYFHIKDFSDSMSDTVKQRINAMTPQRNTRMGAAIRHAAGQFDQVDSSVRLLILLGDGFPNDSDYKQAYAISDTYKAISELRSADIHVHAITVNIDLKHSEQLDSIFGHVHHTCISDITELPDKLLRIYSTLTRN